MPQLPTGTVTLLFTDIEGSTRLLQRLGDRYAHVLKKCRGLLRLAFQQRNGYEVDTQGDAFFVVFERAVDAVAAAILAQRALFTTQWPDGESVRVRIGLHTGEPQPADEGYIGLDVHRAARIMSAAHGGQVLLSQTTRDQVAGQLSEGVTLRELGEYHLKDIAEACQLCQLVVPDLPDHFPPLATVRSQRFLHQLPAPSTAFVGRERDVAVVVDSLDQADIRLLTLIGPAGVGKTRLALQVVAIVVERFAGNVIFAPLDQVSEADGVMSAIAQALGIREEKDLPLIEQVQAALRTQPLLLILDNFEQVIPARLAIARLLAGCPQLKILITSRTLLHVQAEHLFEVLPLPLPGHDSLHDLPEIARTASVELFVQRAQAIVPDFRLTATNVEAVVGICTRLDGIPLAIELAAARLRHSSASTVLSQLEQGLVNLQGDMADVPQRQQTLRDAIAWSYHLLEKPEQRVFCRLAVFAKGATLEAVEQVCTADGEAEKCIAEILQALVDKSMLQRQGREEKETRFLLLQTLSEYGRERLIEAGELSTVQVNHAAYYLSWIEGVAPLLSGAQQVRWLDRLDQEDENVRAALEWLLNNAQQQMQSAEQALRLCVGLLGYWEVRGYFKEGLIFLERALGNSKSVPASVRAQALQGAGYLALMQDDEARAERFLRESQALFRESGDRGGMANILRLQGNLARVQNNKVARRLLEEALVIYQESKEQQGVASTREALAQIAITQGDYARARTLLEGNLVSYSASGEIYSAAYPLYHLARVYFLSQGDHARARTLAEESISRFKTVGNIRLVAYAHCLLGQILLAEEGEDRERVRSMLEESLATFKAIGEQSGTAEALVDLARLAARQGENEAAQALYAKSWKLLQAVGAKELAAACLEGWGQVAMVQGKTEEAVRAWGTAATLRATIIAPLPPVYRTAYLAAVAHARQRLGEETFQAYWAQGHRTPWEQVELTG